MECIQDARCTIHLKFNEDISLIYRNSENCARGEAQSCFLLLSLNFTDKHATITFDRPTDNYDLSVKLDDDLLNISTTAMILRRYTVLIHKRPTFNIHVYITLECEGSDDCTLTALQRYWPRFTNIQQRQTSFLKLSQFFHSNLSSSSVDSCFTDTADEIEIETCPTDTNNSCFASINGSRYCINNEDSESPDFVYSFNQVDHGHTLPDENIFYSLVCYSNNCNNNETIYKLSTYARQFADYASTSKDRLYNRALIIHRFHFQFIFLFITILMMKNYSF